MIHFQIPTPDQKILPLVQAKIDNLNKPKGSLGRLEELAIQVCLVQQTLTPTLSHPCHLLMGGDPGILHHKVARGTANFLHGPAMSASEMEQAMATGAQLARDCHAEGCNILCVGEMGIANTSPSSIWMSLLGGIPLDECIGAGAGLDNPGVAHKRRVLHAALDHFLQTRQGDSVEEVIQHFGGFEMVGAIGAMLAAAERGMLVLVDGFIMTACMLAASRLHPAVLSYAIFGHCGDESGHQRMLQLMDARPLLHLGLRLGEGTGALCAYPLVESAVRMTNEMNNFEHAKITKYF